MRVIAGSARGRRLRVARVRDLRPTSDRARETLFNVLGADVVGALVLDLFAGSGALGIESLSRGAVEATFIDRDRRVVGALRSNLEHCGFSAVSRILDSDWRRGVRRLEREAARFDLVFADPPYAWEGHRDCLRHLRASSVLADAALAVVEHRSDQVMEPLEGWRGRRRWR